VIDSRNVEDYCKNVHKLTVRNCNAINKPVQHKSRSWKRLVITPGIWLTNSTCAQLSVWTDRSLL